MWDQIKSQFISLGKHNERRSSNSLGIKQTLERKNKKNRDRTC